MFGLNDSVKVYLSLEATDMRCGFDRLASKAQEHFNRDALDGSLYVFVSRNRKRIKIIHWASDSYWLHYKRLETSTFRIATKENGQEELTAVDLEKLLSGIDLKRIKLTKKVERRVLRSEAV
jgi:transposase